MNKNTPESVLQKVFGYQSFRHNQQEIIENVLAGNDAFVLMPTGGGKSLCYQIPALCFDGLTIVISPLIALMQDQVDALKELGVQAEFLNSTTDKEKTSEIFTSLKQNKIDILYVSPERLNIPDFQIFLQSLDIAMFVIDEAHCISQWGHDFRPEYTKLNFLKQMFPRSIIMALTATADELTRKDIIKILGFKDDKFFISSFNRPNIKYSIQEKNNEKKQLLTFIEENHKEDSGIIYCISRNRVEQICEFLNDNGYTAYPYHAGLSAKIREKNQEKFLKEENVIMVATIAFGMGINKPNVRFVAHLDLPRSIESYYQETGRAGRDGLPANAWMVYGIRDIVMLQNFIKTSNANPEQKRIERNKLEKLVTFCETVDCRREFLLNYFGETDPVTCDNCDTCITKPETYDATIDCQKFLSCVYRVNQTTFSFGGGHIINILTGKEDDKIVQYNHNQLSTFGIGTDLSQTNWRTIMRQLVGYGYIEIDGEYSTLSLSTKALDFFKTKNPIWFRKDVLKQKSKKKEKKSTIVGDISERDEMLFKELKDFRFSLAKSSNIPPYVIFHDKTLIEMATVRPQSLSEMTNISGVGESKLKKYGDDFLTIILQAN